MLSHKLYAYHVQNWNLPKLPSGVQWINPFADSAVQDVLQSFLSKYFEDDQQRIYLLGINPGRFGAGVTGIPFTDPIRLADICNIKNSFSLRSEMSSVFIYDMIIAFGGPTNFYRKFIISSICPLGFLKDGKNYNYYDDKKLEKAVTPYIERHMYDLLDMNANPSVIISIGQGKNYHFLEKLNKRLKLFDQVLKLPHPRWVMQYRLKRKDEFLSKYVSLLKSL